MLDKISRVIKYRHELKKSELPEFHTVSEELFLPNRVAIFFFLNKEGGPNLSTDLGRTVVYRTLPYLKVRPF
jgi:hypothetical protein